MKKYISILLCLVMLLGLVGCAQETEEPYIPTGDALSYADDYTGPAATEPQEEPQKLTLAYYADASMNPYASNNFTNRALFPLIYQSLFVVDRNYNVYPMLCSRYTVTRDMKRYDFYIDENATFSDGTRLTAQDVVASLNAADNSSMYSGRFRHVRSISLTEDGAVRVSLYNANENLPLLLDIPIVKELEVEAEHPLGTGPYVWGGTPITPRLMRNNRWWCRSTDLLITAESIQLMAGESPAHIRDQFEFEDVGLVCADPGSDSYADYRCDYELWECETGIFVYLAANRDSEVFGSKTMRQALTFAIDRDLLVDKYYRGFARSASLPASPSSPYYNVTLAEKYAFDSSQFSLAVRNAGMQGKTITLLVNSDDSLRTRAAREVSRMLNDCGLVVEVVAKSGSSYLYSLRNRNFDLYLGQTKLSANMDLSSFFSENGNMSYGGLSDSAVLTMCMQAMENHGNYFTLHKTIMDEGLFCPVLFRSYAVYAERGLLTDLQPSRDNVFFYTIGKDMASALTDE